MVHILYCEIMNMHVIYNYTRLLSLSIDRLCIFPIQSPKRVAVSSIEACELELSPDADAVISPQLQPLHSVLRRCVTHSG